MIRPAFYLFACLAVACVSVTADATTQTVEDIVFTEIEARIIREYFEARAANRAEEEGRGSGKAHKANKGKSKGLPPGLAKKESLPPGLAKQLSERGTLPPGLAKRDLPPDLESRLPPPAEGTERVIVDNDVVLIQAATRKILDVLFDAVNAEQ